MDNIGTSIIGMLEKTASNCGGSAYCNRYNPGTLSYF